MNLRTRATIRIVYVKGLPMSASLDAILFFVGGALTLGAGVITEQFRDAKRTKQLVEFFKQGLRDDLTRAIAAFDELIRIYATEKYVSYDQTRIIGDSRNTYDRNQAVLPRLDADLRQDIVRYYQHVHARIPEMVNAQQRRERVQRAEFDAMAALVGQTDPATGQPYTVDALRFAARNQLAPQLHLDQNMAADFLSKSVVNNIDALKKEASGILQRLGS